MTLANFEIERLSVLWYSSELTDKMQKKMQLGQDWRKDFYKLYVLNRYLDLLLEYTLQTAADYAVENTNFFTIEEMLVLQEHINDMLNTDFAATFILDP
jgi:hypothetical protein